VRRPLRIAAALVLALAAVAAGASAAPPAKATPGPIVMRDAMGRRLGEIRVQGDGRRLAYDAMGRRLGEYDPRTNVTRDAMGRRIGEGDFLAALIAEAAAKKDAKPRR